MQAPNGNELLRIRSHRANEKLKRLIGDTQNWYSWKRGGYLVEVPQDKVSDALKIKGVARARIVLADWHPCWSWNLQLSDKERRGRYIAVRCGDVIVVRRVTTSKKGKRKCESVTNGTK